MPTLGASLDFAKYEGRNLRGHQLGTAPSSPVTGQLYYNTADNTLYWYDGSQWVSARGGAASVPPATTGALGTIQLAGDLSGTATSPQIAAGVITDVEVAAANKDGLQGTASMRTLGFGAQQALYGNVALNQIQVPTGSLLLNNQRIASMADPTAATDAATKQYVDNLSQGLDTKLSARAIATTNITLSGTQTVDGVALVVNDRCVVAGQSTAANNGIYSVQSGAWTRTTDADTWNELISAYVFIESGTANADSGWLCTVDPGGTLGSTAVTWTQFSGAGQITAGAGLTKTGNTLDVVAGDTSLTVAADNVIVNTSVIATVASVAAKANSSTTITAGNGLTGGGDLTTNRTLDVGGTTNRITVAADAVDIAATYVGQTSITTLGTVATGTWNGTTIAVANGGTGQTTAKAGRETGLGAAGYYSSATHGAGTSISITQATHGLRASRGLLVQVQEEATGNVVIPDISVAATGDVTVTFGASVSANAYRVTVIG